MALLLVAACREKDNPVTPDPEAETTVLRLSASMEQASRVGVDAAGHMTWQEGDRIAALLDNGDVVPLAIETGAGTASATFSAEIPSARKFAGEAAYPWWDGAWTSSPSGLMLTMPESIPWQGDSYVPAVMKASLTDDMLPFRHEGAIMQFSLSNIPQDITSFKFTTSAAAVMGRDELSCTFAPGYDSRVFHIPVSAGTLPSYTVSLCRADGSPFLSKTKSTTTSVARCDFRKVTPLSVEVTEQLRVVSYNSCNGMERDSEAGYDNFVAWVNSVSPDILVLCEAGDMDTQASRWGHPYTAKVSLDSYPVVITSSRPMAIVQRITNPFAVVHGAVHVRVGNYDIVGLHLLPTRDTDHSGNLSPEEYAAYGYLRKTELSYIVQETLDAHPERSRWIVCGDFNAYSPLEKTAVSPYGGKSAYTYSEPVASICYEVYPIIAERLKDVIYYKGGTAFKPSMYHGRSRLDYIFASESLYSKVSAADVMLGGFPGNYRNDDTNPSDHMPLYMELTDYSLKAADGKTRLEDWPDEDMIKED